MDIKKYLQRDGLYIIVCLFALFACIWTLGAIDDYKNDLDTYYINQMIEKGCINPTIYNTSFNIMLPFEHAGVYNVS